jgi:hypothetical protein
VARKKAQEQPPALAALIAKITAIEAQKEIIAEERDKLRDMVSDVESILESLDRGVDGIDEGVRALQSAVDSMSEYI